MPFEPNKKPDSKLAQYLLKNDKREFDTNKELITWSTKNSKKIDEKIKEMLLNNFEIEKIKEKLEKDNNSFNRIYYNFNKKDLDKRIEKVKKSIIKSAPKKKSSKKVAKKSGSMLSQIHSANKMEKKKLDQNPNLSDQKKYQIYKEKKKRLDEKYKMEQQKLKDFLTVKNCDNMLKDIKKEFLQIIDKHISTSDKSVRKNISTSVKKNSSPKTVSTLIFKKPRKTLGPAKKLPPPSPSPKKRKKKISTSEGIAISRLQPKGPNGKLPPRDDDLPVKRKRSKKNVLTPPPSPITPVSPFSDNYPTPVGKSPLSDITMM
jgi:hypothetical protein